MVIRDRHPRHTEPCSDLTLTEVPHIGSRVWGPVCRTRRRIIVGVDQATGQSAASDIGLFRQAWADFTAATAATVAPEATYQAWLAHFAIQHFGLLRVVREIDFGTRYFGDHRPRFRGPNVMVDLAVLRNTMSVPPLVYLPRRAWLAARSAEFDERSPRSGLARLSQISVITELKVSSTQGEGLDYAEVAQDFIKLSAILDRAEFLFPNEVRPAACVCVFDNHPTRRFNFDLLQIKLAAAGVRPDVELLALTR